LPVEIQYMIYNMVLIHDAAIETCRICCPHEDFPHTSAISRNDLSLLAVNRYVRSVTLPLFWGGNAFYFDASCTGNIRVCINLRLVPSIFLARLSPPPFLEWANSKVVIN
jgi:hypothetical protein